jgi:hypothetical protein
MVAFVIASLTQSGVAISPLCHCEPASGGRGNLAFKNKKDEIGFANTFSNPIGLENEIGFANTFHEPLGS